MRRFRLAVVAVFACGGKSGPPQAPVVNTPTPLRPTTQPSHLACPTELVAPWEHELYSGCPVWPLFEGFALCDPATCRPCSIRYKAEDLPGDELQRVDYDASGRWIASHHVAGHEGHAEPDWKCRYDGDRIAACSGPSDFRVELQRDGAGRIATVAYLDRPDINETIAYDRAGLVASLKGPDTSQFSYDDQRRLVEVLKHTSDGDDSLTTYAYDAQGRVAEARSGKHVTSYSYDDGGRLVHVGERFDDPDEQDDEIAIAYDTVGRPTQITLDDTQPHKRVWAKQIDYDCKP
jgi:YD repeat-containing protein